MTERNNRIRKVIEGKSSQQKLADKLGITRQAVNLRLSSDKDIDSIDFIRAVAELTGSDIDWLINGKDQTSKVTEPGIGYEMSMSDGEFFQKFGELVVKKSDYRFVPKSIIEGDYRIVLKSELDEMNRMRDLIILAKDQTIALQEKRIAELERISAKPETAKK
jgi:transcriptional regulator with XRE-family HTH domain